MGFFNAFGGYVEMYAYLLVSEDKIFVVGDCDLVVFVNGFDRKTGEPLVRFGTEHAQMHN